MALPPSSSPSSTPAAPVNPRSAQQRAAENQVFLREVDEAVRQDEMAGFAKRYGIAIGVAVVLLLVALGGYLWWRHNHAEALGEQGEALTLALDQVQGGQFDKGATSLAPLAKDADTGVGAAAAMMQAGIAEEQGKHDVAAKGFAALAANAAAPAPMRDLARIRGVAAQFDTLPPQQVVDQLKPLAVPGNPWFGNAGELVGMAYLKQGRRDLAGPLFGQIARDTTVEPSLRGRARQLAGLLGVDSLDDVAKPIADTADAGIPANGAAAGQ